MQNTTNGRPGISSLLTPLTLLLGLVCSPAWAGLDSSLLAGLKARAIGPAAMSGRIAAIDAVASDPNRLVVGASTGGVWISANGGLTWKPVFDDQPFASIGAVAINQSNPDVIWVGTGEGNVRNSTSVGGGIFRSVDGGRTWQAMGLAGSERINRIALDPDDPDTVYVAAMGKLWGPNEERGVFKTVDGGKTWKKILYVDDSTGATDVKVDPANPNKLYAAMWQFRRWPYYFESGGPGSGMYISKDGGESWQHRTQEDGLPAGELGRMVFAVSRSNPERVYALVEAEKSALLRTDDGGESWTAVNQEYNVADRPFYYTELAVDPQNEDIVYNIGSRVRVSIDGGKTFAYNPVINCCAPGNTIHIDNHAYWINPNDPDELIFGNDGGLAISHDKGATFRFVRNLPLAQFYHIAVDNDQPYHVFGGLQDNGSWRGPAEVWENAGIRNAHWQEVGFGDGFDARPDPATSRSGYAMSQGGALFRWNLDTAEQRLIVPAPPADVKLRFNWNAALAIDPFDAGTIYFGSQFVHRSRDRGLTWETISADLTSNDPKMQTFNESGGLTADVTAAENYTTIVSIAPSALERGVLWVGSDDGRVHVTRDGGEHWARIDENARGVAAGAWVPMIAPSPHQAGTAFVVLDDHRRSDMETYVYRVDGYGNHWKRLPTKGVRGYALSVLQDTVDPDLLFLGTEFGLYFSVDGGEEWTQFKAGLPTVSVMDMAIQPRENDLVLGTHGRAAYVIDDYSGLRQLRAADFGERLKILSAAPGQQYTPQQTPSTRFTGSGEFRGENEPYGVMLTFMASGDDLPLPDAKAERARKIAQRERRRTQDKPGEKDTAAPPKLSVSVKDADGNVIRSYNSKVFQGVNRLVWSMQRDGVKPVDEDDDKKDGDDSLPPGPEILPGHYTLTLSLGDAKASRVVEVLKDPRSAYSMTELTANYDTRIRLLHMRAAVNSALRQINSARDDVATLRKLIDKQLGEHKSDTLGDLRKQAGEVKTGLDELEKLYRVPEKTKGITYSDDKVTAKLGTADYYVGSSDGAPSQTALAYVAEAESALEEATGKVNAFMSGDLAAFRDNITKAGITLLPVREAIEVPE